jgi:hypothetical protein
MKRTATFGLCAVMLSALLSPWAGSTFGGHGLAGQKAARTYAIAQVSATPQYDVGPDPVVGPQADKPGNEPVEGFSVYVKWAGVVVVIAASVIATAIFIGRRRRQGCVPPAESPETPNPNPAPTDRPAARPARPRFAGKLSEQVRLMRFFLQLFKTQQEADPEAPAQIVKVDTHPTCPDETYEMRILHKDEWMTRRMSIGLLGQGGGSRSQCFYVIYDSHMVIKIPPAPLTGFDAYNRRIAAEGAIVARLAPRICIVPKVSVILKAVHGFPDDPAASEELLEKRYLHLLETQPEYQEYLKIDETFVFFMDLAKHFFLNTVLEEIHSGYPRLVEEARQHPELLWDSHGFVSRYGEDAEPLRHALQEVFICCENPLRTLIEQSNSGRSVPAYHLRQWFLTHLAGETVQRGEQDLPAEVIIKINQLLEEVVRENRRPVEQYRRKLVEYIRRTRFSQYRPQLENLASDILDLLACFGRKKVALRDLKPENLFVAGNPEEYPAFLNDPDKFTVGLIDVETAVDFDVQDPLRIAQPQLAGTPLYATPTHLMGNALLLVIYRDLPKIFHLQDWFATIAILFRIASGENLFATTAHVFPEVLTRLKALDTNAPGLQDDVARILRLFWNSAVAEFNEGLTRAGEMLHMVEVRIPAEMIADMVSVFKEEIRELDKTIGRALAEQTFFNSADKRRFLKEASSDKVGHMKNKLIQDARNGQSGQSQIVLYFELLEKMKRRLEVKHRALAGLSSPKATLTLDQLLEYMFQKVFEAMYLAQWPELSPRLYGSSAFLTADIATYQATM